jgi:membrane protein implicated in regulation of membrane protease activity
MGFEDIACCYHRLTAYLIQYLLLGTCILGILFNILGFILLDWGYVSGFIEFLYVMCFIFNILSAASILLLIYFRKKQTINNEENQKSIKISFANIIISVVGMLFGIICLIYISVKYYDHESDIIDGKKAITGWDKFWMFLILGLNIRLLLFLFFFWVSILIRLLRKTSGAYVNEKKNEVNISTVSNTSNEGNINNNQIQSTNNNVTRDVKVIYGTRELNLK